MPSTYAHYRFGQTAAAGLSGETGKAVRRFRQLYDVGLHGPDLFFYYNPLWHTKIGAMGHAFHMQSGQEFFGEALRRLRNAPSEAGLAYLHGVLAHYTLDRFCHPLIQENAAQGIAGHMETEAEFDRFLLELDGKNPPCLQDVGRHLHLTRAEARAAAFCYPSVPASAVAAGVRNMRMINRALAMKNRKLLERAFRLAGSESAQMVMPRQANPRCAHLDAKLLHLYNEALDRYPLLAEKLSACLKDRTPLGEEFAPTFG